MPNEKFSNDFNEIFGGDDVPEQALQGRATVARVVHTHEVAGSTPAPATSRGGRHVISAHMKRGCEHTKLHG